MAAKAHTIILYAEHGKPYMLLIIGIEPVRGINGIEGRRLDKKRMAHCNDVHRGSKFALIRKDADLSAVFHDNKWR